MSDVLEFVREKVDEECIADQCSKEGCRVNIARQLKPYLLIDMDSEESPAPKQGKRCDYLFVSEPERGPCWIVPMELQQGSPEAEKILPQLRAGARIAEEITPQNLNRSNAKFRPVVAYGKDKQMTRRESNRFKRENVSFQDRREPVRFMRCGERLTKSRLENPS